MNSPFKLIVTLVTCAEILAALSTTSNAQNNTFYGVGALHSGSETATFDLAIGFDALYNATYGNANTAIGYQALYNLTSDLNETATGFQALFSVTVPTTVGSNKTGVSVIPLDNVADGYQALYYNTAGYCNVATGFQALFSNTTGYYNTASGFQALLSSTSGNSNTATGASSLADNTSGAQNTADGQDTLDKNTSGSSNTAGGFQALNLNTTGTGNTATGYQALYSSTTGYENIALGYRAGYNVTSGRDNIEIGNQGEAGDTKDIRIGAEGTQTATLIAGIYNSTVTGGSPVYVNSNGRLGLQATSSRRFKQNIKTMGDASDALLSLKPVTYEYKPEIDPDAVPQFGLVAEEVDKVCPNLVIHDNEGKPYAVRYDAVNVMLLNEFLKEHKRVEEQGKQLEAQEQINAEQAATIAHQQKIFDQQQQQINSLTASLKEQATLLQKVSAQIQLTSPGSRIVSE